MIRNGLLQLQQTRINRYDIIESTAQNIKIGAMSAPLGAVVQWMIVL